MRTKTRLPVILGYTDPTWIPYEVEGMKPSTYASGSVRLLYQTNLCNNQCTAVFEHFHGFGYIPAVLFLPTEDLLAAV